MRLLLLIFLYPFLLIAQPLKPVEPVYKYSLDGHVEDKGEYAAHGEAHKVSFGTGYSGEVNSCLVFSEAEQYVSLPIPFDGKAFSISFWVYPEQHRKASVFIRQKEINKVPSWQISLEAYFDGKSSWDFKGSGFWDDKAHFRGYPHPKWTKPYGRWFQVLMTYTPDEKINYFINGVLVHESRSLKGMGSFHSEADIIIGNHWGTYPRTHQPFIGKIDEICIFDRAILPSEAEIWYFRQAHDLKSQWRLANYHLLEKVFLEDYLRRKEGRLKNNCFLNNRYYRLFRDPIICQFLGDRRFKPKPVWYTYNTASENLFVLFEGFDTLSFNSIPLEEWQLYEQYQDSFIFRNPVFEMLETDSVHLKSVDMYFREKDSIIVGTTRF